MTATALVIQECQRGVLGPDSLLPLLAEAAAPRCPSSRGWRTGPRCGRAGDTRAGHDTGRRIRRTAQRAALPDGGAPELTTGTRFNIICFR
jgi:hypothetical protein